MWRAAERARLRNQLSRQALENDRIADLYWKSRERKALLTTKIAREAMQHKRVADLIGSCASAAPSQSIRSPQPRKKERIPVIFRIDERDSLRAKPSTKG